MASAKSKEKAIAHIEELISKFTVVTEDDEHQLNGYKLTLDVIRNELEWSNVCQKYPDMRASGTFPYLLLGVEFNIDERTLDELLEEL